MRFQDDLNLFLLMGETKGQLGKPVEHDRQIQCLVLSILMMLMMLLSNVEPIFRSPNPFSLIIF